MAFDPSAPISRRTLFELKSTGAAHASYSRLVTTLVLALLAGVLAFVFLNDWWFGFFPLVLASFTLFGISEKEAQQLDIEHHPSASRRTVLRLVRVAAMAFGVASLLLGLMMVLGTALEWDWMLDLLE